MTPSTCAIAGAGGLVGSHLLALLLDDAEVARVTALVRHPLAVSRAKLVEAVVDFDHPESLRAHLAVDAVFCALGTTLKQAGSQAVFRQVDLDYPLTLARLAIGAGAKQYLVVTAVGADAHSRVFYSRVKGELEDALRVLSFPRGLHVFHPSMLLGERKEHRPAERAIAVIMRATAPLFGGPLTRYRAIQAEDVARAMRNAAKRAEGGVNVYEGRSLFELAKG
jgi:uncharacterized protein YbjT (DUF2867 family)